MEMTVNAVQSVVKVDDNEKSVECHRGKKYTTEERDILYEKYINFKSSYYKAQWCVFYMKGICWLGEKCQFSHGAEDFILENSAKFLKDKRNKTLNKEEINVFAQRHSIVTEDFQKSFINLFEYQNKNQHLFKVLYTLEELNEGFSVRRKNFARVEIYKHFHKACFEDFIRLIFKGGPMSFDKYQNIYESVSFTHNLRRYERKLIYQKSEKDRVTKKKKLIVNLFPSSEEMMESFIGYIISKLTEDLDQNAPETILPLSFKYLSAAVLKNAPFEKPTIVNYMGGNNLTTTDFIREINNHPKFIESITKLLESKTIPVPYTSEKALNIIQQVNIEEVFTEIRESFWRKFLEVCDTDFAFANLTFIQENYMKLSKSIFNNNISENNFILIFKKILFQHHGLVFHNNNNSTFLYNLAKFETFSLDTYFESDYEKRCCMYDNEVRKEVESILNTDQGFRLFLERLKTTIKEDDYIKYSSQVKDKEIIVVDDLISLYHFASHVEHMKETGIDLEGSLHGDATQVKIQLIQVFDSTSQKGFIFDISLLFIINKNDINFSSLRHNFKVVLTYFFENIDILKVFHDGRADNNALHQFLKIHTQNFIDNACVYSAHKQIKIQTDYLKGNQKFMKQSIIELLNDSQSKELGEMFSLVFNSVNPGLNRVLKAFEPNGTENHLKEKYHALFQIEEEANKLFYERPLNEEFLLYSHIDVKYLLPAFYKMKQEIELMLTTHYRDQVGNVNLEVLLRLFSNEHLRQSCN